MMRFKNIFFGFSLFIFSSISFAAEDRLECVLPNGDKFVLIQNYKLSSLNVLGMNRRSNESGFVVYFEPAKRPKFFRKREISQPETRYVGDAKDAGQVCLKFSTVGRYRFTNTNVYSDDNGGTFKMLLPNGFRYDRFGIFNLTRERELQDQFPSISGSSENSSATSANRKLRPDSLTESVDYVSRHMPVRIVDAEGGTYIEVALEPNATDHSCGQKPPGECPIIAVWQAISKDDRKSWSQAKISKDAKAFVIGKTLNEQPGFATVGEWKRGPG